MGEPERKLHLYHQDNGYNHGPPNSYESFEGGNKSKEGLDVPAVSKESLGMTESDSNLSSVEGTTKLYDQGGLKYIPMPTADPNDPMNLPRWRTNLAILSLCLLGGLAMTAGQVIGNLVPVFILYYAGLDPHILTEIHGLPATGGKVNPNPVSTLGALGGPPIWKVYFLSTMPLLANGLADAIFVPLSIAIGRRPVLILCGALSFTGALWSGFSQSLDSHIAGMCFQGLGAGANQAIVPLVVQDLVFIHQRNRAMSLIWGMQGVIMGVIGIVSPYMIANLNWRWMYYIMSALTAGAWVMVVFLVPETRWKRSTEELAGKPLDPLPPGHRRPPLDYETYGQRTMNADWGLIVGAPDWTAAFDTIKNMISSFFFPNIFWMILVNSSLVATINAISQLGSPVLLAKDWPFVHLGLGVIPIVLACPFVWLISGVGADKISNWLARRNGGQREPEMHLVNLIFPLIIGIVGCILFGIGGSDLSLHWIVLLVGIFFVALAFLSCVAITGVYVVEAYPDWAGPVLINISAFRCIIGFAFAFRISKWTEKLGYMGIFGVYAGVIGFLSLGLPLVYFYGKTIRARTTRFVRGSGKQSKEGQI